MVDYVVLTDTIIKMIVEDKEAVSVRQYEEAEDELIHLEVLVAEADLGRVIGKGGKTIKSIRSIIHAAATLDDDKKIKIDIDSY